MKKQFQVIETAFTKIGICQGILLFDSGNPR